MEGTRFDAMVRALGAGGTRRGFVGLLAALAAGGAADEAGARRRCRKDSPAGQCCKKDGTCSCTDGGTVCGANCCHIGQTRVDGTLLRIARGSSRGSERHPLARRSGRGGRG